MTRLLCEVPFCNHTIAQRRLSHPKDSEWICADHWRLTDRVWRKRYSLFRRRFREDLAAKMWARLKRQAIERAAGI